MKLLSFYYRCRGFLREISFSQPKSKNVGETNGCPNNQTAHYKGQNNGQCGTFLGGRAEQVKF